MIQLLVSPVAVVWPVAVPGDLGTVRRGSPVEEVIQFHRCVSVITVMIEIVDCLSCCFPPGKAEIVET